VRRGVLQTLTDDRQTPASVASLASLHYV